MNNQKTKTDTPEIPAELEGRPTIALTQLAAESIGAAEFQGNDDDPRDSKTPVSVFTQEQIAQEIDQLCAAPPGYEPCLGLTAEQQRTIQGTKYPGQPALDPELGDYTPEFIVWLYSHHPRDAHVRYYTRLMPSVGRWIMKEFPEFRVKSLKAATPMDFKVAPRQGREVETLASLRAELAALKAQAATQPVLEDPEMAKLRAEITEMKNPSAGTVQSVGVNLIPTRRPRTPQA